MAIRWFLLLSLVTASAFVTATGLTDGLRGDVPLNQEPPAPTLLNQENLDIRRVRSFAMQPPTIPHKIDGYQLDINANRCMFCHARTRIEDSKAIPVSATHYMDRDGTIRGDLSPRRYFCTMCHVPQANLKPPVDNTYQDFDTLRKQDSDRAAPGNKSGSK